MWQTQEYSSETNNFKVENRLEKVCRSCGRIHENFIFGRRILTTVLVAEQPAGLGVDFDVNAGYC